MLDFGKVNYLRLLIGGGIFAVLILLFWLGFLLRPEKNIATVANEFGKTGEDVTSDLSRISSLPVEEEDKSYKIEDTKESGIQIEFAGQEKKDPEKGLSLTFPKNYQEGIQVSLDPERTFSLTDLSGKEGYSSDLLTPESIKREQEKEEKRSLFSRLFPKKEDVPESFLRYTSKDKRKTLLYAYQKDQATGEKRLRHWTLYERGVGVEKETYEFKDAKLKLDGDGNVEVFYYGQKELQNEQVKAEVDPSLLERAQRTLEKELGSQNQTPDAVIPAPYYIDKDGKRHDIAWQLEENRLSVEFEPNKESYPIALDPTLQFTAPGKSSSGDIIDGEASNDNFAEFLASGDLNADGKTDLVVGSTGYSSFAGRLYIFYNDGLYPGGAGGADVIITGEASSSFGKVTSFADLNADGKTDLIVGATSYSSSAGRAYIFYNDGSYPSSAASADVLIDGEASSSLGRAFAFGDFNADGDTDIVVTAFAYSSSAGRTYIFYNDGSIPTTAATADVTITGEATSVFGYTIASGDLNADGKTDLAVGAYLYSSSTGRTYIFYNDGSIPTTAATADVTITGDASTNFGRTVTVGDFNTDGETDLAVGANTYSSSTGRVYIFYNDGSIPTTAATADVTITGDASSGSFGNALASGDANSDGKIDLIVGADNYTSQTGRTYIFYNDGSYPSTAATADVAISGEKTSNAFGASLAFGDFNSDGKNDFVIGGYGGTGTYNGRAYVFYSQNGVMNTNNILTGGATNNYFSSSLTTADLNADGETDLIVGADGYSGDTGRVYIFYNDGRHPSALADADVTITGETTTNQFGVAVAAGDFNSDGETDLAVGALTYSTSTGRVYIFYNDGSIPTTAATADVTITGEATSTSFGGALRADDFNSDGRTDLAAAAVQHTTSTGRVYIFNNDGSIPTAAASADVIITGQATSNSFGLSLTSGDFNSDGRNDLAAGAYQNSSSTGRIYIFYNDGSIPTTAATADVLISGESNSNQFGYHVVSGDFNSDGRTDIATGAFNHTSGTGRAYIFYNDGSYPGAGSADVIISGEATSTFFGTTLAAGDFNSDGRTDLAVCAYGYSTNTGRVHIFYNDGSYPTLAAASDVTLTGETTSTNFGLDMTSGDINADGKTDLIVGAYAYTTNTGRVYIYEGTDNFSWTIQQQYGTGIPRVSAAFSGEELKITGETTSTSFGSKFATGDFNADGKIDLAVGAPDYSSSVGRIYVFYSDGSFTANAQNADLIITGEATSLFGTSLAAGDMNSDGKTDLIVGAYQYSTSAGRVYIFYNDGNYPNIASSADITITGSSSSIEFGNALAVGDVNASGTTDLIVGAIRSDAGAGNAGSVYIFYNDGSIPTTSGTADVTINSNTTSDGFGSSLLTGDFNADGEIDLAVGAIVVTGAGNTYLSIFYNDGSYPSVASSADVTITQESGAGDFSAALAAGDLDSDGDTDLVASSTQYPSGSDAGRVYIFYNDGSYPSDASTADVIISGGSNFNTFGYSLATADFNADGRTDLVAGAYRYTTNFTGRTYIIYNDGSYPSSATSADVTLTGETSSNQFGAAVAIGDFNTDGKTDLAVGAPQYSSDTGRVYLYTFNDNVITGSNTSDLFGIGLHVGDINSDGRKDLIVGASGYSSSAGRVYIFYGDTSYPTAAASADVIIDGEASSGFGNAMTSGDFDADGDTDLVVSAKDYSSLLGRVYIFYNDGSYPSAASSADVTITGSSTVYFGVALSSGDMNSDGETDLIVDQRGTYGGTIYFFYNDGSYPSSTTGADVSITGGTHDNLGWSLATGDFDTDGDTDLAAGSPSTSSSGTVTEVTIYYNDGSWPTTQSTADVTITSVSTSQGLGTSLVAGDFNSDGETDIAAGATGTNTVYIFYNDGSYPSGAGSADAAIVGATQFSADLSAGDFNRDGRTDLAVGDYQFSSSAGRAYIFYNDGSYPSDDDNADIIISGEASSNEFGGELASGDINADGITDLVVGAETYSSSTGRAYMIISEVAAAGVTDTAAQLRGTGALRGSGTLR